MEGNKRRQQTEVVASTEKEKQYKPTTIYNKKPVGKCGRLEKFLQDK